MGSLLRTADGLGINKVYMTGITPYPIEKNDARMPHISRKVHKQIQKTALGAEETVRWSYAENLQDVIDLLHADHYVVMGLEQSPESVSLLDIKLATRIALIVGNEVDGLNPKALNACDYVIEIPMYGKKESFNVVEATTMALYHCRFFNA